MIYIYYVLLIRVVHMVIYIKGDLDSSPCPSVSPSVRKFCNKGGKVGTSVCYGQISCPISYTFYNYMYLLI